MTVGLVLGLGLTSSLVPAQRATSFANNTDMARLVAVSGNNQLGQPGEVLREPLVVRLEDQFGNPLVGVEVTGQIIAGEGRLVGCPPDGDVTQDAQVTPADALRVFQHFLGLAQPPLDACARARANVLEPESSAITPADALCIFRQFLGLPSCVTALTARVQKQRASGVLQGNGETTRTERTDANGMARFFLRAGASEGIIRVQVSALEQQVEFVAIVGFVEPVDIAIEADGSLVVTDAFGVVRVHPTTGDRSMVSGPGRGSGPPFAAPRGIAVDSNGTLVVVSVVTDFFGGKPSVVVRVDPSTGNRTVISGVDPNNPQAPLIGNGPLFNRPQDIAVGDRFLWVVDGADGLGLLAVVRVDPATGDRTIVSGVDPSTGELRGNGPRFFFPRDIAIEADGSLVVVGDFTTDAADSFSGVVRVNPATGDRTIVATNAERMVDASDCLSLDHPDGIAVEAAGTLVVAQNSRGFGTSTVLWVDPTIPALEDNCTVISGPTSDTPTGIGTGERLLSPTAIAIERDGNLVAVDALLNAVVRVDRTTGNRTVVSRGASFGEGRLLLEPGPIAVEADNSLVVVDNHDQTVVRVNPDTGDRTVVSGCPTVNCASAERIGDSAPPFAQSFRATAIEADGALVGVGEVTTSGSFTPVFPAVMRVNLQTGVREVVSGCPVADGQCVAGFFGSGPPLEFPVALAVEPDGHLVVVDSIGLSGDGLQAVVRVDPTTGNRSIVSGVDPNTGILRGSGPPFVQPNAIAVEGGGSLVVVEAFGGQAGIVRVDPATGDRTVVTGIDLTTNALKGNCPLFSFPFAIAVEGDGSLVVLSNLVNFTAVVRVDRVSGDCTIVSSDLPRNRPQGEVVALTYWPAEGVFLLADHGPSLFRLTADGAAALVGFLDHAVKGLAFSADAGSVLYTISSDDDQLRGLDPIDASTVSRVTITVADATVEGGSGLATHPLTGELWGLLTLERSGGSEQELVMIAPATGVATRIGNTGDRFASLAFDAAGTLYGVTDDGALIPETLFTFSTINATATAVLPLGRGDSGEALGFNPTNGLLYHASGSNEVIFESVAIAQRTTRDIPLSFGGRGRGPLFVKPQSIAVEASGSLVVVDGMFGLQAVVRVDAITGDRTLVSR